MTARLEQSDRNDKGSNFEMDFFRRSIHCTVNFKFQFHQLRFCVEVLNMWFEWRIFDSSYIIYSCRLRGRAE